LAVAALVKGKLWLSETATGERTIISIASTSVAAKLNTVERLWLLTTNDGSSLDSTGEAYLLTPRSSDAEASLRRSTVTSRVGTRGFAE